MVPLPIAGKSLDQYLKTGVPGIGCLATAGPGPYIEVVGLEYRQALPNTTNIKHVPYFAFLSGSRVSVRIYPVFTVVTFYKCYG